MSQTLLIIDIQNDYFAGGAMPLREPEAAAAQAATLLATFRSAALPVIHVQHVWEGADAPFMRPGTPGVEIHDVVRPFPSEPVLTKAEPNAFLGTDLAARLAEISPSELVVVGMMTSMCIDSTVRAAAERGFTVTLVHDACAAPDLEFGGVTVQGTDVHTAFVAALGSGFATVQSAAEVAAGIK